MIDNIFEFDEEVGLEYEMKEEDQIEDLKIIIDDDLLLENIKEQIKNPLSSSKNNNLEIFEGRIKFLKMKYSENSDTLKKLLEINKKFYDSIFREIEEKYSFGLVQDTDDETKGLLTHTFYNFFILNYKKNLETFLFNFIYENRKILAKSFDLKKKNIETIAMKKIFKSREDAIVVANIRKIIRDVCLMEMDYNVILKDIIEEEPMLLTNFMINNYVLEKGLVIFQPNFNQVFFRPIIEKDEDYSQVIIAVMQKLYNTLTRK